MSEQNFTTYSVTVTTTNFQTGAENNTTIRYHSRWAARYMAREYAECVDVINVDVTDNLTGEVILTVTQGKVVYDTEG